jgi:hypothetical protein
VPFWQHQRLEEVRCGGTCRQVDRIVHTGGQVGVYYTHPRPSDLRVGMFRLSHSLVGCLFLFLFLFRREVLAQVSKRAVTRCGKVVFASDGAYVATYLSCPTALPSTMGGNGTVKAQGTNKTTVSTRRTPSRGLKTKLF